MDIKGLIFDFDGVIVDTEYAKYIAWQEIFNSYGVEISFSFIESIFGFEEGPNPVIPYLEKCIGEKVDQENVLSRVKEKFYFLINKIGLRPGIAGYLESARNLDIRMVIASNAKKSQIMPLIDRLEIEDYFLSILTREKVSKIKPDPEIINLAIDKLGLSHEEIIAFDDSNVGLKAAKAANVFCVAVPNELTKHFNLSAADMILYSMSEKPLPSLLEEVQQVYS